MRRQSRILLIISCCLLAIATSRTSFVSAGGSADCAANSSEEKAHTVSGINMVGAERTMYVMVLVHGIMGNHKELGYVKQALEREFVAATATEESFLVHSATSNDHNTLDGIETGGRRLAEEINELLKGLTQETSPDAPDTVYLSILGNSLGGLYARYALAHIDWNEPPNDQQSPSTADDDNSNRNNSSISIIPHIFVTTATPHLGVRDMTYWKVPQSIQPAGAWYMKKSGSDLFRYTDVIRRLCQDDEFLRPLSNFTKRIAYANAFSTDAAVPTSTAAFLSDSSSSVHSLVEESSCEERKKSFLHINSDYPTIRFQTQDSFSNHHRGEGDDVASENKSEDDDDDVDSYSRALDSLGWTKVFVDVRSHIPAIWKRERRGDDLNSLATSEEQRQEFSSAELKERLSTFDYNTLPFGHSFLVASAKNPIYTWFYSGGRPLVDRIAKELVHEMTAETLGGNSSGGR